MDFGGFIEFYIILRNAPRGGVFCSNMEGVFVDIGGGIVAQMRGYLYKNGA